MELGLALGVAFYKLKSRFLVVVIAGATLFIGILTILFVFNFPMLGPGFGTSFHFPLLLLVLYAWIEAVACSFTLKRLAQTLPDSLK